MIASETIDRVRDANDIVETLSEYIPNLKRAGKDFKALCPFHQEKTASFLISPTKGIYHCFGCGVGGDVFKFIMEMDRCSYPEAIRKLAEKKGIFIQEEASKNSAVQQDRKKVLLQILERAAEFYHKSLLTSEDAKPALTYLTQSRGLTLDTIKKFKIGWALGPQNLVTVALKSGATLEDLREAGLAVRSSRDGKNWDWFRRRIVFPIWDIKGQIVGFGGRILDSDDFPEDKTPPKYLNSPETPVFQKGKILYGFYQGTPSIRSKKNVVVLEGYMDVIGCFQAGFLNGVAPLGTSLTIDQCQILKRYVDNVILLFDADKAGDNAATRGAELLLNFGFIPTVSRLPNGVDSDEYLQNHSLEDFENILKSGINFLEFCLRNILKTNAELPEISRKNLAIQSLLPLVSKLESAVMRSEMVKFLADKLSLSQSAMIEEFNKVQKKESKRQLNAFNRATAATTATAGSASTAATTGSASTAETVSPIVKSRFLSLQEELILCIVQHPYWLKQLDESEQQEIFSSTEASECWASLRGPKPSLADLQSQLGEKSAQWLNSILIRQITSDKPADELFATLLKRFRMQRKERQLKNLSSSVAESLNQGASSDAVAQFRKITSAIKRSQT